MTKSRNNLISFTLHALIASSASASKVALGVSPSLTLNSDLSDCCKSRINGDCKTYDLVESTIILDGSPLCCKNPNPSFSLGNGPDLEFCGSAAIDDGKAKKVALVNGCCTTSGSNCGSGLDLKTTNNNFNGQRVCCQNVNFVFLNGDTPQCERVEGFNKDGGNDGGANLSDLSSICCKSRINSDCKTYDLIESKITVGGSPLCCNTTNPSFSLIGGQVLEFCDSAAIDDGKAKKVALVNGCCTTSGSDCGSGLDLKITNNNFNGQRVCCQNVNFVILNDSTPQCERVEGFNKDGGNDACSFTPSTFGVAVAVFVSLLF